MIVTDEGTIDVGTASAGRFPSDPQAAFERWDDLRAWAERGEGELRPLDEARLSAPVPRPTQIFAIGLNYVSHATEAGLPAPRFPQTFTKFQTSIGPPNAEVGLPSVTVDWEVELVAVIGRHAQHVAERNAWSHIAGLTVGQDLTDREVQLRPPAPQFSLGKSFPGFGPIGPFLVTPDELDDPDDLVISGILNGETVQHARTSDLIFSVPALVSNISAIVPLLPGDLIFTGTPSGIGATRTPPRFLKPSDELISTVEGVGTMKTRFRKGTPHPPVAGPGQERSD